MLKAKDVKVPLDVSNQFRSTYIKNYLKATHNTGKLVLFAGDQKVEHLNKDFFGTNELGKIPLDDSEPEHLFKIASHSPIGVFASQFGLISKYGMDYKKVPYLIKMNSKTDLVHKKQMDPLSKSLWTIEDVLLLRKKLNVLGIGYTVYLGSEYESEMLTEASQLITQAHRYGLLAVIWMYPRGKTIYNERSPEIIAGAAGVAACLGADFVKVNYPKIENHAEAFRQATLAAGRTKVITSGGGSIDVKEFLQELHDQIHISKTGGSATGRNVHQKTLKEAIRMCEAIASIVYQNKDVKTAYDIYSGKGNYFTRKKRSFNKN